MFNAIAKSKSTLLYLTEQKRNTYVQDLYCNNLTSSLPVA